MNFFVPCPPGAEDILTGELKKLGAGSVLPASRGVGFKGDLTLSYRACLELRTASRILYELVSDRAGTEDELYKLALSYPWDELFPSSLTISCRVTGVPRDKDPRYATLKLKDAVVDRFSQSTGIRPYVDRKTPDIRIEARWDGRNAVIYLNWSGRPLHERGYRLERTDAVLRETTAAAVLAMSGWSEIAGNGGGFVDPVCGSGTLLAEAAMMAVGAPPGIHRKYWGFEGLRLHNDNLWRRILNDATIRYGESLQRMPLMVGFDNDGSALKTARSNLRRAGLNNVIRLERHDITTGRPAFWPAGVIGLVCADPPYGVRTQADPLPVYNALGSMFRTLENGWRLALLAPDRKTAAASCLRAEEYYHTVSGGMDLVLAVYDRIGGGGKATKMPEISDISDISDSDNQMDSKAPSLKKILEKNFSAMATWAEKTSVTSYRIWDADMPEFNAAVDWYEGRWLHIQEFVPPGSISPEKAHNRLNTLISVLKDVTGCRDENLYLKTRQRGHRPYKKKGDSTNLLIMRENGMRFFVNFIDYLDTGIFLDNRSIRSLIRSKMSVIPKGRFLNLFAYTGTASVMAAAGGALQTVSVDISNTYLNWARDNMKLNRLDSSDNSFIKADSFEFLERNKKKFNLIFIDPPAYSNGSGRPDWSMQEDHTVLITLAMKNLSSDGLLLFSENYRRFKLDPDLNRLFSVKEITRETTEPDFFRRNGVHRCWEISHRG